MQWNMTQRHRKVKFQENILSKKWKSTCHMINIYVTVSYISCSLYFIKHLLSIIVMGRTVRIHWDLDNSQEFVRVIS